MSPSGPPEGSGSGTEGQPSRWSLNTPFHLALLYPTPDKFPQLYWASLSLDTCCRQSFQPCLPGVATPHRLPPCLSCLLRCTIWENPHNCLEPTWFKLTDGRRRKVKEGYRDSGRAPRKDTRESHLFQAGKLRPKRLQLDTVSERFTWDQIPNFLTSSVELPRLDLVCLQPAVYIRVCKPVRASMGLRACMLRGTYVNTQAHTLKALSCQPLTILLSHVPAHMC